MRKLFLISLFVLACGGSDGNGGGGVSGTVGGRAFTVREVRAIPAGTGSSPCTVTGIPVPVGVKAFALHFASYADACGDFGTSQCRFHQNAQNVTLILAKIDPAGTEPALGPGTYTVYGSINQAVPDGAGRLNAAFAQALATDATCVGAPSASVSGGTLRLDQVSATAVSGNVNLTFQDGSSLRGDFSAPVCPGVSPDICQLASTQALCSLPPTCVP